MAITLRNMAQVKIPPDLINEILGHYVYYHRDGSFIKTFKYSKSEGCAYLPLNITKLQRIALQLGEEIIDERSAGEPLKVPFVQNPTFEFRGHQAGPAQDLLNHVLQTKYGVLKADCGCGKTVTMTYVAGGLNRKTLIIVDMGSLVAQWQETFQMVWNKDVQIINKDTKMFSDVCIVTFQLLNMNPELTDTIRNMFGCLL